MTGFKYPVSLLRASKTFFVVVATLSSESYLLNSLYAQSLNLSDSLLRVMEKQKLLRGSRSLAKKGWCLCL